MLPKFDRQNGGDGNVVVGTSKIVRQSINSVEHFFRRPQADQLVSLRAGVPPFPPLFPAHSRRNSGRSGYAWKRAGDVVMNVFSSPLTSRKIS